MNRSARRPLGCRTVCGHVRKAFRTHASRRTTKASRNLYDPLGRLRCTRRTSQDSTQDHHTTNTAARHRIEREKDRLAMKASSFPKARNMRFLIPALAMLSLPTLACADVARGPNGALLCETANELKMAQQIIRNKSQPDHNLRCWNVSPGSTLVRIKSAGPYVLVRQPQGSQGFTSPAWLRP